MNTIPKASHQNMQLGPNMALAMMIANSPPGEQRPDIVDEWGYTWRPDGCVGYRRTHDRFFLPNIKMYDHKNHSVEARIEIWNRIKNSNGETVVGTISFGTLFP